jgi:hypothetical protein
VLRANPLVGCTYHVMRMSLEFFWPSRRITHFDEFCLQAA